MEWKDIQTIIDFLVKKFGFNHRHISDGNHTFEELYEFRLQYNAGLFNAWHKLHSEWGCHKSKKHHDGKPCFDGQWFVVSAHIPGVGLVTNHYRLKDWDLFKIPEEDEERWAYDGTTSADVLKRMEFINKNF